MYREAIIEATRQAAAYLDATEARPVARPGDHRELRDRLGGPLPEAPEPAEAVVRALAEGVNAALVNSVGPRYFGFVVGGVVPAALAADWLTSTWDQNAGMFATSPAAAQAETVVAGWLLELLGLPPTASVGLVTGGQMANFTGLLAARDELWRRVGWDIEQDGASRAPPLRVLVGDEAHATIYTALRFLGIGRRQIEVVPVDGQGRMRADQLRARLAVEGFGPGARPTLVCAQAGNVNTGAFDPLSEIAEATRRHGAWLHVDGAFGLWAACHPEKRALVTGLEAADSWATDGHKWLNVPYDSGIAIVRDPQAHRRALAKTPAAYLVKGDGFPDRRDGMDFTPEASRRARAFPLYAGLRSLGRQGVVELVERCCLLARRLAERLLEIPGARILNEVVLNQVLLALQPPPGVEPGPYTGRVLARVQEDGTCWVGPTVWQGHHAVRVSISNWRTRAEDVDRAAAAIAAAAAAELGS